jgi:hypothetical protein
MCSYELRAYPDAYRALREALATSSFERPLTEAQRQHVAELLARTEALLAIYTDVPARATVLLDGAPATIEPGGVLLVGLGAHDVVVTLGDRSARAHLEVRGGERGPLPFDRRALLPPEPAPVTEPATEPVTVTVPVPVTVT